MNITKKDFAKKIDHTILSANAKKEDIYKVCTEAIENNFYSVCVNSYNAAYVSKTLKNTNIKTCVVVGFPLGANLTCVKTKETKEAISQGADEIDMVINIAALKDKIYDYVLNDIKAVCEICSAHGVITKVILETCYLNDKEKIKACKLATEAKADFVKTSTGFGSGGAKIEDVRLLKKFSGPNVKVKASGGIRSYEDALSMLEAGADRLGLSSSVKIIHEIDK